MNIDIFTAKLTNLCYDQKPTSLQSNGMAAIPKIWNKIGSTYSGKPQNRVADNLIFSFWYKLSAIDFFQVRHKADRQFEACAGRSIKIDDRDFFLARRNKPGPMNSKICVEYVRYLEKTNI